MLGVRELLPAVLGGKTASELGEWIEANREALPPGMIGPLERLRDARAGHEAAQARTEAIVAKMRRGGVTDP